MALTIRPHTYRGKQGYSLSGHPHGQQGGWPVRMFFESREAAERHRAKLNIGRDPQGMRIFQSPTERQQHVLFRRHGR